MAGNRRIPTTSVRSPLHVCFLALISILSLGSVCVSPQPPTVPATGPGSCGGALGGAAQAIICDHCMQLAQLGGSCSPNLCDSNAGTKLCNPEKGLVCEPTAADSTRSTCVQGTGFWGTCSATTAPCIELGYCFHGSSGQCRAYSNSVAANPITGSPPPPSDRCEPWVPNGQPCDSNWDNPICLPCVPGTLCDRVDHTCKRPCGGNTDCPSSGSHCVLGSGSSSGFCSPCVDHEGSCTLDGSACCFATDQCSNGSCCRPNGSACTGATDCCGGTTCVNGSQTNGGGWGDGTCQPCGWYGQPCCSGNCNNPNPNSDAAPLTCTSNICGFPGDDRGAPSGSSPSVRQPPGRGAGTRPIAP